MPSPPSLPPRGWRRPRGRRQHRLWLPVTVAVIQAVGVHAAAAPPAGGRPLDPLAWALLVAGPLLLAWRARYRVATLVLVAAVTVGYFTLGYPYGPAFLALLVAVTGAIVAGYRIAAWTVVGAAYLAFAAGGWVLRWAGVGAPRPALGTLVATAVWTLLVLAVAEAARNRAAALAEIGRSRAEQARAQAEQDRAQAEQRRRQEADERLRIARELHDVLGHHLSLISVQAGVGLHLMDERPEQARTALLAIRTASTEALREVRSVLGILRGPDEPSAPRTPAPTLANVAHLVAEIGGRLLSHGEVRPVPAEVDRAGYRIVQEALTNVRRHAGPAAEATVTLDYLPDVLVLAVTDDGTGSGPVEPGNGLAGMRARAAALGGTLAAGFGAGGGFRVEARLPIPARAS